MRFFLTLALSRPAQPACLPGFRCRGTSRLSRFGAWKNQRKLGSPGLLRTSGTLRIVRQHYVRCYHCSVYGAYVVVCPQSPAFSAHDERFLRNVFLESCSSAWFRCRVLKRWKSRAGATVRSSWERRLARRPRASQTRKEGLSLWASRTRMSERVSSRSVLGRTSSAPSRFAGKHDLCLRIRRSLLHWPDFSGNGTASEKIVAKTRQTLTPSCQGWVGNQGLV